MLWRGIPPSHCWKWRNWCNKNSWGGGDIVATYLGSWSDVMQWILEKYATLVEVIFLQNVKLTTLKLGMWYLVHLVSFQVTAKMSLKTSLVWVVTQCVFVVYQHALCAHPRRVEASNLVRIDCKDIYTVCVTYCLLSYLLQIWWWSRILQWCARNRSFTESVFSVSSELLTKMR
jgi:hypothetical protein